ncbi:MAG: methyltransferase domain-containing protein [Caldilineaceae bacterium]
MAHQLDDNHISSNEGYTHGYDSAITQKIHTGRTVDKQASWFLPYLKPGMTLLDCGCATGSITVGFADVVAPSQVIGVDISEAEIERARKRATEAAIKNVRFEVGNIYQLDFPDQSFDAIFSHNVLEHVGEPSRAIKEMHRVLKPGGIIGVRDVDLGGRIYAPTDALMERFWVVYESDWVGVNGHPRIGHQLGGLLIEAGFTEVKASASYEVYSDPETRGGIAEVIVSRLSETDFVERAIERQFTNADELEAMKAAWQTWQERPDGFLAASHCEAVGRKA